MIARTGRPQRTTAPAGPRRSLLVIAWACWWVLAFVGAAAARQSDGAGGSGAADGDGTGVVGAGVVDAGAGTSASGATGEVAVTIVQFGLGGAPRPGAWVGVQIDVQDRGTRVRGLLLRLNLPDADGDTAFMEALLAASPGVKQRVWLYGRLPSSVGRTPIFTVQAFETNDNSGTTAGPREAGGDRAGRLLGSASYRVGSMVPAEHGVMAVVGRPQAGLDQYTVRYGGPGGGGGVAGGGGEWAPLGHELVDRVVSLRAADLPDRWMGYEAFDTLVWTGSSAGENPADLSESQAQALREWVLRGGHLVVVLPAAGQTWTNPRGNPLFDVTPRVRVVERENYALESIRPMLVARDAKVALPGGQTLLSLEPLADIEAHEAMAVLTTPEGWPVVSRRLAGTGAVTLVGVPVLSRQLLQAGGVEADVFWHRVLGRRGELVDAATLATRAGAPVGQQIYLNQRVPQHLDRSIPGLIAKTGRAAVGVLLALVLFSAYWLVAGPLGFSLLRRRGREHHAWLLFVASAGVFTGLAWGGVDLLRVRRVEGRHVSLLDHVYGQDVQRARTWVGLLLPQYGQMTVRVGEGGVGAGAGGGGGGGGGGAGSVRGALASWDAPGGRAESSRRFLDARGYRVDAREPSSLTVPTRSTVKELQADWAGAPRWKMPLPVTVAEDGTASAGAEARLSLAAEGAAGLVTGALVHGLPGPMRDVTVIVVRFQRLAEPTDRGRLMSDAWAFKLADEWAPGAVLDLSSATPARDARSAAVSYLARLAGPSATGDVFEERAPSVEESTEKLMALSFFPLLEPPLVTQIDAQPLMRRRVTHGWDVARWFTQPCVMILGHVEGPPPTPLGVDELGPDELGPRLEGRTLVRWVYPLPAMPTVYPSAAPGVPGL